MNIQTITRDELLKMLSIDKNIKVVDVLSSDIHEKEHIKGAISIPFGELSTKAPQMLDKNATIITYCGSFTCPASTKAAEKLLSLGYTKVFDYKGGLKDYKEAGLPLEGSIHGSQGTARTVKFQGTPLTLVGRKIKVGMHAPNFKATNSNLEEVTLDMFKNKIKVLTTFPSLDTPVCDLQVKEFNKRATKFGDTTIVLGLSKDLPFAQQRFCQAHEIKNLTLLSDYKTSSFGINYGMLIKENNLLARGIIIVDTQDIIRYVQIVDELTTPPNYDDAINNLATIVESPFNAPTASTPTKCTPCEAGTPPLPQDKIEQLTSQIGDWQLVENKKLVKEFKFKDFMDANYFLYLLATLAEEQGHHPTFTLIYNKLKVTLTTHASGELTDNDFIMAQLINEVTN